MAADAAGSAQLPTPEAGADGVESKAAARSGRGGHAASHGRVPACKPCRERKRKCDGGRPCSRCVQNGRADECVDADGSRAPNILEGIDLSPDPSPHLPYSAATAADSSTLALGGSAPPTSRVQVRWAQGDGQAWNGTPAPTSEGQVGQGQGVQPPKLPPHSQAGPAAGWHAQSAAIPHAPSQESLLAIRSDTARSGPATPDRVSVRLTTHIALTASTALRSLLQTAAVASHVTQGPGGGDGETALLQQLPALCAAHDAATHGHCGQHAFVKHVEEVLAPGLKEKGPIAANLAAQALLSQVCAHSSLAVLHLRAQPSGGAIASISGPAREMFGIPASCSTSEAVALVVTAAPSPGAVAASHPGSDLAVHVVPCTTHPAHRQDRLAASTAAVTLRAPLLAVQSLHIPTVGSFAGRSLHVREHVSYFWQHRELSAPPVLLGMSIWFRHKAAPPAQSSPRAFLKAPVRVSSAAVANESGSTGPLSSVYSANVPSARSSLPGINAFMQRGRKRPRQGGMPEGCQLLE